MIAGPTIHVGFDESLSLSEVTMALDSVGAGAILESDWLGEPNIFRVDGISFRASRSRSGQRSPRSSTTASTPSTRIFLGR